MKQFHPAIQPLNNNVIYVYRHIDVASHEGFLKIGQKTGLESRREAQQNEADNVQIEELFKVPAIDINGNTFTDHELHKALERKGYERERKQNTKSGRMSEWFKISLDDAKAVIYDRIECRDQFTRLREMATDFKLRPSQQSAVDQTYDWWQSQHDRKYLWNAKPRFGKTLTAYEFARRIKAKRILVVTHRTAISDSWFSDYEQWIKNKTNYLFGSAKNNVTKTIEGNIKGRALTTAEACQAITNNQELIYYISLSDIKGKDETKAEFKHKNKWLFDTEWDLFIIDEAHEGIQTDKFDAVFDNLQTDFTLHLSGTPFKAIASHKFGQNIYNWTYADEQEAKATWDSTDEENPYADMPTMNIFTYQLSDELKKIASSDDFSFDFAEFFKVKGNKFEHEDDIILFLDKLAKTDDHLDDSIEQYYPFADKDTRDILRHTFWLLPGQGGIKIANTLKPLLQNHPVFKNYEIISAVSNGDIERQNETALKEVQRRITTAPWQTKTITLSCGQLTTGVTVREWTGVLMLNNLKSPEQYLQAAFRSQNPWAYEVNGEPFNKTDCYVFDFAPDRILKIVAEYADKLITGGDRTREQKIKVLLNFLSVISQDENGKMKSLDANDVLTLPMKLDVADVVNNGFMDNKLFSIGNLFNLPKEQREAANEYLSELRAVKNQRQSRDTSTIETQEVEFDDQGSPIISQETVINTTNGLLGERKYAVEGSDEAAAIDDAISRGETPDAQIVTREELEEIAKEKVIESINTRKKTEEQEQRDHLRGFSRTIPMFLMAYGKDDTTLANFDKFVSAEVFSELAGISIEAFRFLRDDCKLFNEEVFNMSIKEFLRRKRELARYYKTDSGEDIFEFIPPQSRDNNQIFTPKKVVSQMIDTLEVANPSLFKHDTTRFIDPHMKSGLFIAEIVKRLYQHSRIEDENERIKHILTKQVYGFASTKILLEICHQTIAGFDYKLWGNFVLQDEKQLENDMQSAIMETWGRDMKFDVIIGNPPYQMSDGGHGTSATPIYHKFVEQAIKLKPRYLSMIIPARWYSGGKGLDDFRDKMLHDTRLRKIVDYPEAIDAFSGVQIKGGVMYFLWDRDNKGDVEVSTFKKDRIISTVSRPLLETGATTFIRYNEAIAILKKVQARGEESLSKQISSMKPFGLRTFVKASLSPNATKITLYQNGGVGYIDRSEIIKNNELIDKYKVLIPRAGSGSDSFPHSILARPFITKPGSACTETYIVLGSYTTEGQCNNLARYVSTRFFRFMVLLIKSTQDAASRVYRYVPLQDFTEEWTDEKLYKKYGITDEEIAFIESMIRPMELE